MVIGNYIIATPVIALTSISVISLIIWSINRKIKIKTLYVFLKTGFEAHRDLICDFLGTCFSFFIAYQCFETISKTQSSNIFYILLTVVFFLLKSLVKTLGLKIYKTNNDHIFDSKLEIAKELHSHLKTIPPVYNIKKGQHLDFENRIRSLLKNHINYISKHFKPGFSWDEHSFSVSVLFFDHAKHEWHLFDTFYEEKAIRRTASDWPLKRKDFIFPNEMYTLKDDRTHNIIDITKPEYESVLQVPLYFTNTRPSIIGHTKGNIYCIVCFASKKKSSFKGIPGNHAILRKYFLPEVYLLEQFLYQLYRIKVR